MKSLEYVKEHIEEFEKDNFFDSRWTNRFLQFVPVEEWGNFGFEFTGEEPPAPIVWTEENILKQLKADVEFGYEKAMDERGISSELMSMVVQSWCDVLENGLNLNGDDGWYHHKQFEIVAKHYGWDLE